MTGGAGADDFDFNSVAEIGKGATRDVIRDFAHLDRRYRSVHHRCQRRRARPCRVHASSLSKGAAFTGVAGQLCWFQDNRPGVANDKTIVEGDINGNRVADLQIQLAGLKSLTSGDFIL